MRYREFFGRNPLLVVAAAFFCSTEACAGGLRCSLGEVVVENLQIGTEYSLRALANMPLSITNTGDETLTLRIEPLVPTHEELRHGAEAIPDGAWARAFPDSLVLGAGETIETTLSLDIPKDTQLLGRKFQVGFWTHTLPREGQLIAYGLKSRVLFTIASEKAGVAPASGGMSLGLSPATMTVSATDAGISHEFDERFVVHNSTDRTLTVEMEAFPDPAEGATTGGRSAPELVLSERRFTLQPQSKHDVRATLTLPSPGGPAKREYRWVVAAGVVGLPVRTRIESHVVVHVQE